MTPPVAIVGAGPAGATAAIGLARLGIASVLLDDNPQAGGQIFRAGFDGSAPRIGGDARGARLRARLQDHGALIDHRAGHEVIALYPGPRLWVAGPQGSYALAPRHLVLASGALEVSVPVPGWTLPGVYTLGGLQILAKGAATVPAGRTVLAGAGPLLYLVGAQLVAAGVRVVAVIDAAARPSPGQLAEMARAPRLLARGLGFELTLRRHGVRLLRQAAVVEVVGDDRVCEVIAAPLDGDWRVRDGGRVRLACDVAGMGFGLRPNTELTQIAGCAHDYDAAAGGWRVRRDVGFATSVANVHAIGDGAGVSGVDTALAEGMILARHLARSLGVATAAIDDEADVAERRRAGLAVFRRALTAWSGLRPGIFAAADAGTMVCRCEDVTMADLDVALDAGMTLPRGLKMRTRAGMGLCQGRTCSPAVQQRIAARSGAAMADIPMPTVRVPLRPVTAASLASLAPTTPAG